MGGAGTEVHPMGIAHTAGQQSRLGREHVLGMCEIKGQIQILGPGEMQLYIVVKLRRQFGITLLVTIGIYVRTEGVHHPITRSLDTTRIAGAHRNRLLQFTQRRRGIAYIGRREGIEIRLGGHRVDRLPVTATEGIFTTQAELDRPVFAKLLTYGDIGRSDMLVVDEVGRRGAYLRVVDRRVGGHRVFGRRESVLDAALQHTGLPELGLEIQFGTVDIYHLTTIDIQTELGIAQIGFVVFGLLEISRLVVVAVIIDIDSQFALQRLGEGVGIVEVGGMLRRPHAVLRLGRTVDRVRRRIYVGAVTFRHDLLLDVHIRDLQDKTERIGRVDIPVVAHLHHVVLEAQVIARTGITLHRGRLAIRLKLDIVLRIHLGQLTEGIGLLAAVVEVERNHIHLQPTLHIAEIHSSVAGRQHTVQTLHHVALGLDIDDSTLTAGIVFRRWIRDNLYLLDRITVRTVEHSFELLTAQIRGLAIDVYLHRLAIDRNVAVLINTHTRCTTQNVVTVRPRSQRRLAHVNHQFVHLALYQRTLGFHLHLTQLLGLFVEHEVRSAKYGLITHKRSLDQIHRLLHLYAVLAMFVGDGTGEKRRVLR